VAEEFGLDQGFGKGGAIDGDEGAGLAAAFLMDGAGGEFLAGAALALDEDGDIRGGNLVNHALDLVHGLAATDEDIDIAAFPEALANSGIDSDEGLVIESLADGAEDVLVFGGPCEIVKCAVMDGVDGGANGAAFTDEDELGVGGKGAQGFHQDEAIRALGVEGFDDDVEALAGGEIADGALCGGDVDAVTLGGKHASEAGGVAAVAIDDEDGYVGGGHGENCRLLKCDC